ncbi:MAG: DNA-3-methyladenine glycosylase I [Flavobacteriaceae bacterium]|nr:DNA-3-methyladenine glycosylase I [Flavobacteriaceae bacterium]
MKTLIRCNWAQHSRKMQQYHDEEWGVPQHNDQKLFEMLTLEGAQAGLSWSTILDRREGYRRAFKNFDVDLISKFTNEDIERLIKDRSIIRNRLKIKSTISNAKVFIKVQKEFNSFNKYIWSFTNKKTIINNFNKLDQVPPETKLSNEISKDFKKRGFTFVGPKITYAFMQSIGIVNDHVSNCFCRKRKR